MVQQIQLLTRKELHSSVYVGNFLTPVTCALKFGYLPKLTVDEIKRAAHVSIILQLTDFRKDFRVGWKHKPEIAVLTVLVAFKCLNS